MSMVSGFAARNTPDSLLREALSRLLIQPPEDEPAEAAHADAPSPTVREVVKAYLASIQHDNSKTYEDRSATLFDLCYGLPPVYRRNGKRHTDEAEAARIHPGLGDRPAAEIIPLDITRWLQAHSTWKGGRRTRIQAVKRAFNYAVEQKLLKENPLRGMKVPKPRPRVTYLTDAQETALLAASGEPFAVALRVLIRTGMRPGIEFAAMRARHVVDEGDRMTVTFQPHETKTRQRHRIIRITAPVVLEAICQRLQRCDDQPLFRNSHGHPWTVNLLSQNFRRSLARVRKKKEQLEWDEDVCIYSCRHTYAKRTLQGYWSGKPTNIETLARLMGHSVQVCRDHYLQWTNSYDEPLWEAC